MALPARQPDPRVSVAEYLRREALSEVRHEYHDGEVLEMSGCTVHHGRITRNVTVAVQTRLDGTPCELFDGNMRVAVRLTRRYVYPDATVICGEPEFDPDDRNLTTLVNPRVAFEVLSRSTEEYDRGDKFAHYALSPSLEEYVMLAQGRPRVESLLRQRDNTWDLAVAEGLDATAVVRCLSVELPLRELYAQVVFPDADAG